MDGCCSYLFRWALPEGLSYERAQLRVRTFDLVYFCEFSTWMGPFITMFGGRWATHMGMLIRGRPDVPGDEELYVLEAVRHGDDERDISRSGDVHTGVRVVSLRERLKYPTDWYYVYVQPVHIPEHTRTKAESKLWPFIYEHNATPYEERPSSFALAPLNRQFGVDAEDLRSLFCSELVALALRVCGLLDVTNVSLVWHTMFLNCELHLSGGSRLDVRGYYIRMNKAPNRRPLTVLDADARLSWRTSQESVAVQALPALPPMVCAKPPPSLPHTNETTEQMAERIAQAGRFQLPD